ncbi:MAG: IS66 family transposase [Gammaproteobacteria bacterium]
MPVTGADLPHDVELLKALVLKQAAENEKLSKENRQLQEQLNLLLAKRFGPSSEKLPADQLRLFNEAERDAEEAHAELPSIIVVSHPRARPVRKPLPAVLPRIEVIHDLSEGEKLCAEDGQVLVAIGEEISEQLDIVPAQVRVIRHVRKKYACPQCQQGVKTAPLPPQPIPKSLASPGLLAHVAVAKYQDALPLYRQERILKRIGVELPRATLASWMVRLGPVIQPLINLMREAVLGYDILQMDETTVQVLNEPGRSARSPSYLWVQRGGPPEHPLILYEYDPSRSQEVPKRLLDGYHGYLQIDGYEGYNAVCLEPGIKALGCWAHARRKFDEALKAQGQAPKDKPTKTGRAHQGLIYIQQLYRIEQEVKGNTPEVRYHLRQQQAKPLLDEIRLWLDAALPEIPPTSATGKALYYLHHQWQRLVRYLEDGRLSIDNNRIENAIRPFVLGRKNWLFCATVRGAKASANLYSLIETAKANGLEPYHYLRHVFTALPKANAVEQIEKLLPHNLKPNELNPVAR